MIKVFSKEWFKKYNKWIVRVAKLPIIGEWIFCIKKYGFELDRNNILEIQPNAVVEDMKLMWTKCVKVNGQWVAYDCTNKLHNKLVKKEYKEKLLPTRRNHYFVRNEFALRLQSVFYPIWITFHIWDIITRPIPQLNLGFDTLTVYPDAGGGGANVTCDGQVTDSNSSWTNTRDDTGATANNYNVYFEARVSYNGSNWTFYRIGMTFDTSTIGSDKTISSATFSGYGTDPDLHGAGKLNSFNEASPRGADLCAWSPANNNNIASGDYDSFSYTSFGTFSYSGWTEKQYNNVSLNASGLAAISKNGITKLGLINGHDLEDDEPTYSGSGNNNVFLRLYSSDLGSNKPKLVVTYTTVVAPTVTTQDADQITSTSARGNGNITDTGGATITRRGFCYMEGTSGDPTTANSVAYDDGTFGTGAFTKSITGLTEGTAYRVRAYAVNSAGTSYGTTVQLYTINEETIQNSLAYLILTSDTKDKSLLYVVKVFVLLQKAVKYVVRTSAVKQLSISYEMLIATIKKALSYLVRAGHTIQNQIIYYIRKSNSLDLGLSYLILIGDTIQKNIKYLVLNSGSKDTAISYVVKASSVLQRAIGYLILTNDTLTSAIKYLVKTTGEKTAQIIYNVNLGKTKSKALRYLVILADNLISKSLEYFIVLSFAIDVAIKYTIKKVKLIYKSLSYEIEVPLGEDVEVNMMQTEFDVSMLAFEMDIELPGDDLPLDLT